MKKFNFSPKYMHKPFIEMTPMIDMVFLLVAFFMVSSSIGKISSISVSLPQAESLSKVENVRNIFSIDSDNLMYYNDKQYSKDEIAKFVELEKNNLKQGAVLIRADKKSSYEFLVFIIDLLAINGINEFVLSTVKN